jgi:2-polyprenyl-6-methoxyphenol hydroxylase-like FAD-dependent oxidoreductase
VISSDVVIIGGGPGGAATAISLLAHAPALTVTLIEATHYEASRVGESLPPLTRSLLETLNVWEAFSALGARESFGTSAVWGQATSVDNEFIFMPANTGWQLDRASFDAMLANEAKNRGAILMLGTSLRGAQRVDEAWRLSLSDGCQLSTKFVVDATGGSASFARRTGARFVDLDRLVGISRFFECEETDARLMVETFANGWWYTAGLPNGKRVTCCVTDADLAQRMKLNETELWQQQLSTTSNVAKLTNTRKPCSTVTVRSTNSRLLDPVCGDGWLAVGDAASRFDPLSSQGIVKALRSGIFASYAIGDLLLCGDHAALRRYQRFVTEEFKSYLQTRLKYYRQEQRWPNSEFWRRRHADQTWMGSVP